MTEIDKISDGSQYARCIQTSKRVRWDIDEDVIRGRRFEAAHKFLPDGLSLANAFTTLSLDERRFVSQIQGRTYANIFALVERFINAKVLELCRDRALGDQVVLEALVRFSDEELKHQALFRRIDAMVGEVRPHGYRFDIDPDAVARVVLGKSRWAVLALTLDIELFTQLHYRRSIDPDVELSELFKDVFLYHWKEGSQHAMLDELELVRHDATLTAEERDRAVDEFIELFAAVDGILRARATAEVGYFATNCGRTVEADEVRSIEAAFLEAYRWQYIHSGAQHPRFAKVLTDQREPAPAYPDSARHTAVSRSPAFSTKRARKRRSIINVHAKTASPTVVNGINVDDLFAFVDRVRTDPAKGKTHWRVSTTWQGQTRSRAEVEGFGIGGDQVPRRFAIDIDEPYELGGSNRLPIRRNT